MHILEARALDSSGNLGISHSLRVIVKNNVPVEEDRTPPDLWWIASNQGLTLQGDVMLQIGFYDEPGLDSVRLLKDVAAVTIISTYISGGKILLIPPYISGRE